MVRGKDTRVGRAMFSAHADRHTSIFATNNETASLRFENFEPGTRTREAWFILILVILVLPTIILALLNCQW